MTFLDFLPLILFVLGPVVTILAISAVRARVRRQIENAIDYADEDVETDKLVENKVATDGTNQVP
jgi:hypothetical protein